MNIEMRLPSNMVVRSSAQIERVKGKDARTVVVIKAGTGLSAPGSGRLALRGRVEHLDPLASPPTTVLGIINAKRDHIRSPFCTV
jgi:hypothetical protein